MRKIYANDFFVRLISFFCSRRGLFINKFAPNNDIIGTGDKILSDLWASLFQLVFFDNILVSTSDITVFHGGRPLN